MATVLLVTPRDVKLRSHISGSVDVDKFLIDIKVAQDLELQNTIGTDLYNRLQSDVSGGTLSGDYEILVNDYIKDMLINYAANYYLPFAAYTISDGGIYKHRAESSDSVSKEEVDSMAARCLDRAQFYQRRLNDYLCNYSYLYPEYTSNSNGDMYPDNGSGDFNGIVL